MNRSNHLSKPTDTQPSTHLNARCWLAAVAFSTLAACGSGSPDAALALVEQASLDPEAAQCVTSNVSVKLVEGASATEQVFVKLCLPAGPTPNTIQLLVHGITYDNRYWDFPDPTDNTKRYSYTHAANAAGFATLAIDRIGAGQSSHPLSVGVSLDSNVFVVHQLVQALRAGTVDGPGGIKPSFAQVVLVGHSYGSWTSWFVASRYHDVDGVVLTGVSHSLRTPEVQLNLLPNLIPNNIDPQFGLLNYDPGYLTTIANKRYSLFYAPAIVDPAVVAIDEQTKGTLTATEIANYPLILQASLDIRAPILLVNGNVDTLFCAPTGPFQTLDLVPGGANCTTAAKLIEAERPKLGAQVPSIEAYILPNAGHDLNLMLNAQNYFAVAQEWTQRRVGN